MLTRETLNAKLQPQLFWGFRGHAAFSLVFTDCYSQVTELRSQVANLHGLSRPTVVGFTHVRDPDPGGAAPDLKFGRPSKLALDCLLGRSPIKIVDVSKQVGCSSSCSVARNRKLVQARAAGGAQMFWPRAQRRPQRDPKRKGDARHDFGQHFDCHQRPARRTLQLSDLSHLPPPCASSTF